MKQIEDAMETIRSRVAEALKGLDDVTFRLDVNYHSSDKKNQPGSGHMTIQVTLWFHHEFSRVVRENDVESLVKECRETAEHVLAKMSEKFGKK